MENITNGDFKYNNSDEDDCACEHVDKLHNFCLEELIHTDNIINREEGYVALENSNVHRIPMPTTLMDMCGDVGDRDTGYNCDGALNYWFCC